MLLISNEPLSTTVVQKFSGDLIGLGAMAVEVSVGGWFVCAVHGVNPDNARSVQDMLERIAEHVDGGRVVAPTTSYVTSVEFAKHPTRVDIGSVTFGKKQVPVIAGPCAIETGDRMAVIASAVAEAGASGLRGGAFKPQTLAYNFQGLGQHGLNLLTEAARSVGLFSVTEVMSLEAVDETQKYVDALQIGARNMQNYDLLKRVGRSSRPVILKRGFSATVEELLRAAEYIITHGNQRVVLCERGIRTFEAQASKFTLDLNAVAYLKLRTHLPVIVDPSHGTGRRELVSALARAAVAVGADGLMIEVHPEPEQSWTGDRIQTLDIAEFRDLLTQVDDVARAVGRTVLVPHATEAHSR